MGRLGSGDILDRSKELALQVIRLARALPRDPIAQHLGLQLLRSGTSVGANLHEADMTDTRKDFCNKVNIAQKEAGESTYWVALLREASILPAKRLAAIDAEATALRKICRQIVLASRRRSP